MICVSLRNILITVEAQSSFVWYLLTDIIIMNYSRDYSYRLFAILIGIKQLGETTVTYNMNV